MLTQINTEKIYCVECSTPDSLKLMYMGLQRLRIFLDNANALENVPSLSLV